jgi:hypothetical protein
MLAMHFDPARIFTIEGSGTVDSLALFIEKTPAEQQAFQLISGHMPFGLHHDLAGRARYITMLREPLDRLVSLYYFIQQSPGHYLYERVTGQSLSLPDLVQSGLSSEFSNAQTRLLAGMHINDPLPCNTGHLHQALEHLRTCFVFTGIQSRFDESLLLMWRTLQWDGRPWYIRQNVNVRRPAQCRLTPEEEDIIWNHNALDRELYEQVRTELQRQIMAGGTVLQNRVRRFRLWNRLLQPWIRMQWFRRNLRERHHPPVSE